MVLNIFLLFWDSFQADSGKNPKALYSEQKEED